MKAHAPQQQRQPRPEALLQTGLLTRRTSRNQVVKGMTHADAEGVKTSSVNATSLSFAHDFSRVPSHSAAPVGLRAKLAVNTPGDIYEQEADRVSEEVMLAPGPQPQGACACGGGCAGCRTNQPAPAPERVQTKRVQADTPGQDVAPPVVHDVLASPGRPLDTSTRVFMEQRFGRDFGQVRVHSDAQAAESASAIGALAYTVAPNIVFGAGQYAPHTTAGRALLAHELTHVVQRGDVIRRRPTAAEVKARKRDAHLKELSEWPPSAHDEWKRLSSMEKVAVVAQMSKRYGDAFAQSFLEYTEHPIEAVSSVFGSNDEHPPRWFQARGYQLWKTTLGATPTMVGEYWVHPSGKMIMQLRDRKTNSSPATNVGPPIEEPPVDACKELTEVAKAILRDEIATATSVQQDLEAQKAILEKTNKTTDSYKGMFDDYIGTMEALKARIAATIDDIETMREQLEELKCPPVSDIDTGLQELEGFQFWIDFESSDMVLQFLRPIKMPNYK